MNVYCEKMGQAEHAELKEALDSTIQKLTSTCEAQLQMVTKATTMRISDAENKTAQLVACAADRRRNPQGTPKWALMVCLHVYGTASQA